MRSVQDAIMSIKQLCQLKSWLLNTVVTVEHREESCISVQNAEKHRNKANIIDATSQKLQVVFFFRKENDEKESSMVWKFNIVGTVPILNPDQPRYFYLHHLQTGYRM